MTKLPFRKNMHVAKWCTLERVEEKIKTYPRRYSTPKYMTFIKKMLQAGWKVSIHEVGVSKYVFVSNESELYKIRFSNHKPRYDREQEEDCDFYVGISHQQVSTTEEIIRKINKK